jgi:hypothetical protein
MRGSPASVFLRPTVLRDEMLDAGNPNCGVLNT